MKINIKNFSNDKAQLVITTNVPDKVKSLINTISELCYAGHTFDVVVDPEDESPNSFEFDGDGSDRIDKIE